MNTILEILRRPISADRALKMSLALVVLGVGLTAAQALTKPAPHMPRIEAASSMKPVILAVDWQEDGQSNERGAVAVAYAR